MWAISEVISVFGNCSLKIIVIIVSYRLNVRFPSNTSLLGSDECAEEKMGDDFYCASSDWRRRDDGLLLVIVTSKWFLGEDVVCEPGLSC